MTRLRSVTVPVIAAMGALSFPVGCAGGAATTGANTRAASRVDATRAQECVPGPRTVCLTAGAGGETVAVAVGSTVDVRLHSAHSAWSGLSEVGPRLLAPVGTRRRTSAAVETSYTAVEPGRTALRAYARPICTPGRACPQFVVLWQVNLRIARR